MNYSAKKGTDPDEPLMHIHIVHKFVLQGKYRQLIYLLDRGRAIHIQPINIVFCSLNLPIMTIHRIDQRQW